MRRIDELPLNTYRCRPERVLQFGEGNFLRAFVDWMINRANASGAYQASVVVCQAIPTGLGTQINAQRGMYTLIMRGQENGEPVRQCEVISSISRCINPYEDYEALLRVAESPELEVVISNTTEAGIAYRAGDRLEDCPPASYPAKLCALLYRRYQRFAGDPGRGLLVLPVELIDENGNRLRELVLRYAAEWGLEETFSQWVKESNCFANTLVDRIVTGYPKEEAMAFEELLGYEDRLMVASEPYNLWVIEAPPCWASRFPVGDGLANVIWTDCAAPYKKRKVRILNGSHTAVVPAAYLLGYETVADFLGDQAFVLLEHQLIFQEIIPSVDMPPEELVPFARQVEERFRNPFITHYLADIQLNSCSKFCARCLPTILEYRERVGEFPKRMVFGLAALIRYLRVEEQGNRYRGMRENGETYTVRDDAGVLEFFAGAWKHEEPRKVVEQVLANRELWDGRNLTEIPGLTGLVVSYLEQMEQNGISNTIKLLIKGGE